MIGRYALALSAFFFVPIPVAFADDLTGWQQFSFGMSPSMVEAATNGNGMMSSDSILYETEIGQDDADVAFFFVGVPPRLSQVRITPKPKDGSSCGASNDDYILTQLVQKYGQYSSEKSVVNTATISLTFYLWNFDNGKDISLWQGVGCPTIWFEPADASAGPSPKEGF